jgi:DNA topoisomerase-2
MSKMISEGEISTSKNYTKYSPSVDAEIPQENQENEENPDDESSFPIPSKEYDYLLSMPLWSLSQEKVNSLLNQKENKKNEIMLLEKMRIEDIWINDIEELIKVLDVKLKFFLD